MNKVFLPIILSGIILLTGCKKNDDPVAADTSQIDLNGTWSAKGYTCSAGTVTDQSIQIVQSQGKLTATKIIGDKCVPAGKVTFTGVYDTVKKNYTLVWTSGTASSPASDMSASGTLTVVSANKLETTFAGVAGASYNR